ncbi:SAM-dependent methyltransferase [Lentzea sp. NBRC 105346]|uniref:PqqD family peptide modification chaperone n=1 Tax=Lentzea sp. NBRC 105346 TaxID=3032205 RepID=UPI0024A44C5D|nr:PqqD family peptide modification chaperone [Lentzea sp. NBRC 105346]GLZ29704.1 SAM-dependent methyltransferase [Lentzea sp. NBRC 105346]
MDPLLGAADLARLRDALRAAGFTSDGLDAGAVRALERGDTSRLLPLVTDETPLGTLTRLFLLTLAVPIDEATAVLGPLDPLVDAGLLKRGVRKGTPAVRAAVLLYPYRQGWLLADAAGGGSDLVVGLSMYPDVLARARVGGPVGSALDVCCGSGVQSMHLSGQAGSVTATDLSPRALRFAATSAALSELDWELLHGNLFEPVAGRRFDLVVANPPFIVKPGTVDYLYRDSGMPLDTLGQKIAAAAPDVLTEGGTMQYLAAFVHLGDWRDRVSSWAAGTGLDAWIVQLGCSDPVRYVHNWSHGAGLRNRADWLAWLVEHDVEAIGWGLVSLRRSGRSDPVVQVDELPGGVPDVDRWFAAQDWLRDHSPLDECYRAAPGVTLRQSAGLGPDGWLVDEHLLTAELSARVNQLAVDLVEGCDGTLTAREVAAKLAAAYGLDPAQVVESTAEAVRRLVERGVLQWER